MLALAAALLPAVAHAWAPTYQCGSGVYARWPAAQSPVPYSVNVRGAGTSEAQTLAVIETSFGNWSEPCCSGATVRSEGASSRNALDHEDGFNTLGFLDSTWPGEFGDPSVTLAVTVPLIWSDCRITEADIVFNEYGHDFCYGGCAGSDVSLEFVATHEMGHFFGLDHSSEAGSIMYFMYSGGADGNLREDDIEGICTVYPDDHCGCTGPGDCEPPSECIDGSCVVVDPCEDVTCDPGESCVDGACVAGGGCPICRPCTDPSECGTGGFCVDRGDGQGRCIQTCGPAGSCPGDSVCVSVIVDTGEEFFVCLNPDAADTNTLCPDGYTCTDCLVTGCDPGEQCFDGACRPDPTPSICVPTDDRCSGCPEGSDGCVQVAEGSIVCTARCIDDDDCGPCGGCIGMGDPRIRLCVNDDWEPAGYCHDGWACAPDGDADGDGDGDGDADGDSDADADGDGDDGRCSCRAPGGGGDRTQVAALVALALLGLAAYRRSSGSRSR